MLAAACTSTSTSGGSTSSTSASTTSTTVDTTPDTETASTSTSTTVPAVIVFTLRGDGLGPFDLGVAPGGLIDALTAQFGPAQADLPQEYTQYDGVGGFESADGESGFTHPFGRTVCWEFGFCAEFGGAAATSLVFVGWTYNTDPEARLASTSGVTIGSRWSDFPAMNVNAGGCYTVGGGDIDGIDLTLQSDGVAFGSYDDLGNYVESIPPPEQVTVTFMQTGEVPIYLLSDC